MTLAALIRKGGLAKMATATPATLERREKQPVASVATVAVACSQNSFDKDSWEERAAIMGANGVPGEWAEGYAMLCTMPRPATYAPERWRQIVDDGGYFLDKWGHPAAALGWRALDVYGVNPGTPECRYDGMGLVPLLQGRTIVTITTDTARINCERGLTQTYRVQHHLHGYAIALWELGT